MINLRDGQIVHAKNELNEIGRNENGGKREQEL